MTKDDILRMAKEADLWLTSDERIAAVTRFAKLIAAHEREQAAQKCDDIANSGKMGWHETTAKVCARAIRARAKTTMKP